MKRTILPSRMDPIALKWVYKVARKNQWRMPHWYDLEDLVSLGVETYFFVRRRYKAATQPSHVQALFQKIYMCRITDLANDKTKSIQECQIPMVDDGSVYEFTADQKIEDTVVEMPEFLKYMVRLMLAEPVSSLEPPYRMYSDGKETLNDRMCQIIGIKLGSYNFAEALRNHLSSESSERKTSYKRIGTKKIKKRLRKLRCSKEQIEKHICQLKSISSTRRVVLTSNP